jgi:actin-related protein 4
LILKKGVRASPLGGNWISNQIRLMFASQQPPVPLVPHYMVQAKITVEAGQPSQATYKHFKLPPSNTFRQWEEERILTEFKESVVQVWDQGGRLKNGGVNEERAKSFPNRPFEMPDGWNQVFGAERFSPCEGLFDENAAVVDLHNPKPKPEHTIPNLVRSAINSVDSEIRPTLLNNIVVCGASSLVQGLVRRIDNEINLLYPGPRVRVQASGQIVERKYASWIGGSILGSLGTFHQVSVKQLVILTSINADYHRCGSQRRNTMSMDRTSLRNVADRRFRLSRRRRQWRRITVSSMALKGFRRQNLLELGLLRAGAGCVKGMYYVNK